MYAGENTGIIIIVNNNLTDNNNNNINFVTANCGYPVSSSSSSLSTNFSDPATPGMLVIFRCSEDLVLVGPDSSACMDDGQWEPDPSKVRCKGKITTMIK